MDVSHNANYSIKNWSEQQVLFDANYKTTVYGKVVINCAVKIKQNCFLLESTASVKILTIIFACQKDLNPGITGY